VQVIGALERNQALTRGRVAALAPAPIAAITALHTTLKRA